MIIGNTNNILDYSRFAFGLQAAVKGVGKISLEDPTLHFSSGWLVTPDLVVAPEFALDVRRTPRGKFFFHLPARTGGSRSIQADLLGPADVNFNAPPKQSRAALLRLEKPVKNVAMRLEMRSLKELSQLYVLHYPAGSSNVQISFGKVVRVNKDDFELDADTLAGSAGAPVLDIYGTVIGMHISASEKINLGVRLENMLHYWRGFNEWDEIAAWHKLALLSADDVAAVADAGTGYRIRSPQITEEGFLESLTREALQWTIHPATLSQQKRDRLLPLVMDPQAETWTLPASERINIIREAGSLETLRRAVRAEGGSDHVGQRVIDRILQGGPYNIQEIRDAELSYWLQIVRWFTGVVPDIPSAMEISREMEKRRTRGKLLQLAGPDFRGREKELGELRRWYNLESPGAMVISGIGGIGKSSLVSHFVLELPVETLIWWLDFDRADIAPDDAVSMLSVLAQQAGVQLDGMEMVDIGKASTWQEGARSLSAQVAGKINKDIRPLLILDGFEVAQQVRRYNELWPVLELLLERLPLRVIVSGRAPVPSIRLAGRPTSNIVLEGMDAVSAREWLRLHDIETATVVEKVLEMSRGIPLILKLAARLVESGGDVQSLPAALPGEIQDGFLYQRVLDRVIEPMLRPVSKDVLVVRRLSREMLQEMFKDRLPEGETADKVFSNLMNEMGLVQEEEGRLLGLALAASEPDELRIRPEVRVATLKLLEKDDPARVAEIDKRAAVWYAGRAAENMADRAEAIYHYLRLGNITEAQKLWMAECASLLMDVAEWLPEGRGDVKNWLQSRLQPSSGAHELERWEQDALGRIKSAAARNMKSIIVGVLREKQERTEGSPLLIYDAWIMAEDGDLKEARELLRAAKGGDADTQKKRWIVRAMLAWNDHENEAAERCLYGLDTQIKDDVVTDEALLIRCARIRMTEQLMKECALYQEMGEQLNNAWLIDGVKSFFISPDIILLPLRDMFTDYSQSSASHAYPIPQTQRERLGFVDYLNDYRSRLTKKGNAQIHFNDWLEIGGRVRWEEEVKDSIDGILIHYPELDVPLNDAFSLAKYAMRRWVLVTIDLFLSGAVEYLSNPKIYASPENYLSVLMTCYTLAGQEMLIRPTSLDQQFFGMDNFIDYLLKEPGYRSFPLAPGKRATETALRVIDVYKEKDGAVPRIVDWLNEDGMNSPSAGFELYKLVTDVDHRLRQSLLYILGPQPLEVLYYYTLGLPFNKLKY